MKQKFDALEELAASDPRDGINQREAIKRSWALLGKAALKRAKIPSDNVDPYSEFMGNAVERLQHDSSIPWETVDSIRNFGAIAAKVFNQSQWAFAPTPKEAADFVKAARAAAMVLLEE